MSSEKGAAASPGVEPLTLPKFGELMRDGALDYAEGEGIGWVLSLIEGKNATDRTLEEIQQEVQQTNAKIDQLADEINGLCQEVAAYATQIEQNQLWTDYQNSLKSADAPIDQLKTYQRELRVMMGRSVTDPADPDSGLSDQDKRDIGDIRASIRLNIDQLGDALTPDGGSGQDGIIRAYAKVLEFDMTHPTDGSAKVAAPSTSGLYTNQYLDPMSDLVDYYTGIMLSSLNVLNETFHVDYTDGTGHYGPDIPTVKSFDSAGFSYIDGWNLLASKGVGRLPADTVANTAPDTAKDKTNTTMTMWTQVPVSVTADPKATSSCYDTTAFCFVNDYTAAGDVMTSSLIPPLGTSLTSAIATHGPGGYADWRVPTVEEVTYLTQGAVKSGTALPAWAAGQGLRQFAARTITSHLGGADSQKSVVGPLLVQSANGPGVLSSDDVTKPTLTFHAPPPNQDGGQNQAGGQLHLVRDVTIAKYCVDWCPTQASARKIAASHSTASGATVSGTVNRPRPVAPARTPKRTRATATAPLNQPTTYNQPTSCLSGPAYTVSPGANAIRVTVVGDEGGAGKLNGALASPGGRGGSVSTVIPVIEGATLRVQVGTIGQDTIGGTGGGGSGGITVPAPGRDARSGDHSGGGGGASGIAADANCTLWLAVGGGGGGGGSGHSAGGVYGGAWKGGNGGDACPLPGTADVSCNAAQSGADSYPDHKLGTGGGNPPNNVGGHSRDGNTEVGAKGSAVTGGRGADGSRSGNGGGSGGGGGAGYYGGGGGGGGGEMAGGGGGGGGASFVIPGGTESSYGFNNGQRGSVTITSVVR